MGCLGVTMNKYVKIAAIAVVALVALGRFTFVYAYAQTSSTASGNSLTTAQQVRQFLSQHPVIARRVLANFLNKANLGDVTGTVVTESQGTLVLSTDQGQVNVLMPAMWTYNGQQLNRTELVSGAFVGTGDMVTIKVLEVDSAKNGFTVSVMVGYEAVNAAGASANAILPFNIKVGS